MPKGDVHKINWTRKMVTFMKKNYESMTNKEIAAALDVKIQTIRPKLYELGLYRMRLEYWTDDQIEFLKNNYQEMGDMEIAEILQYVSPKEKGWTKKHVEKKRNYLKLHRSKEELAAIQQRNVDNGCFLLCPVKRWQTTGQAKEGEIRMWRENNGRMIPRIKISGTWLFWSRWSWEQTNGPIPDGMNAVFADDDPSNIDPQNIELLTDGQLSARNSLKSSQGLSDNYIAGILTHGQSELRSLVRNQPALLELKRQQLILNRTIYEQQKPVSEEA